MRSRSDDIRRRIAKRRKDKERIGNSPKPERLFALPSEDEPPGFNELITYEGGGPEEEIHPLFRKEVFLFKILASACLFLVIAILFRNQTATLDSARNVVKKTMETEFQFATVSNWYEDKFGKPLALLPFTDKKTNKNLAANQQYAVPASGRILENFQKNGQGIMIETGKGTKVEAMNEGMVRFAGVKEGLGKTVIIQHSDQTESWYGNLESIQVNLYEYIDKGKEVGTVSGSAGVDKSKGEFYFAIKKGDHFIDPIQVIQFE
ncbi:M23 family metallopeptidase [Bacillus sp. EB600]|uniref:M23 family metallopeptidase n=1 Tax=Bacillus sp. EB600 TaxID=2806345 RepID=UPI002811EF58|nr:M23 family metallopeptidase [Bacillus sp. EB600]